MQAVPVAALSQPEAPFVAPLFALKREQRCALRCMAILWLKSNLPKKTKTPGCGSILNHQELDRRFESMLPFTPFHLAVAQNTGTPNGLPW